MTPGPAGRAAAAWLAAALLVGAALPIGAPGPRGIGAVSAPGVEGLDGTSTPVPPVDWTALPDVATRVPAAVSEHFRVHAEPPDDAMLLAVVREWAPRLEGILAAGEARFGRLLAEDVDIVFQRAYEARCPARGLAAPANDPPLTVVYVDARSDELYLGGVLAHEIGHHISMGADFVADGIISEGLANWIAEEAVLAWRGLDGWDEAVRRAMIDGTYASLTDPDALSPLPGEDCIERRDRVYALRTSFVAWLIEGWGLDTVRAMPYRDTEVRDERGEVQMLRQPDYVAATGHDLAELERLWLVDVLRREGVGTLLVDARSASGEDAGNG